MNNPDTSEVLQTLVRLGEKNHGVYLNSPCGDEAIWKLQVDAKKDLGEEIPDSYIRLLKITNGLQINCAYFKKAENLVLENLDVFREEIIVLGLEGNMAEYVFDKRDRRFHTINLGYTDERFSSYDTFEEMLIAVLTEQQVV